MTPQEWMDEAHHPHVGVDGERDGEEFRYHLHEFVEEGTQHLAAALEAVAAMSPACLRCQSSHCCSVRDDSAKVPLCVSDPEDSLPLWMPWTNADVQARVDPIYAQVDALRGEVSRLQAQLSQVQAERVVVPAWSANDFARECVSPGSYIDRDLRAVFRNAEVGYRFAASRAHSVPSSRVLKDGEVAVDAAEWEAMCDIGFDPEPCRLDHHGYCQEHNWFRENPCPTAILQNLYALRAQGKEGAT